MLGAAVTSQANVNVDETKAYHIRVWVKWCKFLQSTSLRSDVFLDGFSRWKIQLVLFAFTQAVRTTKFLQGPKKKLVSATVRDTVGYLSQAFKEALRDDGRRDPYGSLSLLL